MSVAMVIASVGSYLVNEALQRNAFAPGKTTDFEAPLTTLVWLTSIVSIILTFIVSFLLVPELGGGTLWWKLSLIISCGTLAGAVLPEVVKIFTSTKAAHVQEVVTASREGGASLNILAGLTSGNYSAYRIGFIIAGLMAAGYGVSE